MDASLREVAASQKLKYGRASDWRKALFEVYYRKVGEHAQLFSVFHCFETAFRSYAAVTLEGHYTLVRWWEPIGNELQKGLPAGGVTSIQGQLVSKDAAHAIGNAVQSLIDSNTYSAVRNGYEFAECCKLSHIGAIVLEHWPVFGPQLNAHRKLTKADFKAKFRRVREARNDVYHHKSFGGMRDVYETAEELLDCIDCSLAAFHQGVVGAPQNTPAFKVKAQPRHKIP